MKYVDRTMCNFTLKRLNELANNYKNSDQAGDATWILTSAFIIFTMQSGFGLLEAGSVSVKNECNIMVKNAVDVIFGSLGYWACGFAFSFGSHENYSNSFNGFGNFFTMPDNDDESGELYARYFFQLSFATTATTIVSGAMAERTNLKAYMFFSLINFISYVFPAHWIWDEKGIFKTLGVVDVAGCGPVHVVGGVSAIVASVILKPRIGIFDKKSTKSSMASPTNVVLGTFMLWWGWLGFNCGSTFGVSGGKWKLASRAAVTTVNAAVGGGIWSIFYCYVLTKRFEKKLDIGIFTSSILGGLVSITAVCALCKPWEALLIGTCGGAIVCYGTAFVYYLKIDDPVSCIPVHCFCGIWGMLCVGLFGEVDKLEGISKTPGILKGGPASFFAYQCLAAFTIAAWAAMTSAIELLITDLLFGLRLSADSEFIGADLFEHGIGSNDIQRKRFSKIFGRTTRDLSSPYIIRTEGSVKERKYTATNNARSTINKNNTNKNILCKTRIGNKIIDNDIDKNINNNNSDDDTSIRISTTSNVDNKENNSNNSNSNICSNSNINNNDGNSNNNDDNSNNNSKSKNSSENQLTKRSNIFTENMRYITLFSRSKGIDNCGFIFGHSTNTKSSSPGKNNSSNIFYSETRNESDSNETYAIQVITNNGEKRETDQIEEEEVERETKFSRNVVVSSFDPTIHSTGQNEQSKLI